MADEKDKTPEEEQPEKKKGLSPIILVAVGAALGGAGTVFVMPKGGDDVEHGPPEPEYMVFEHDETIEMNFNPRKERGHTVATASFRFAYRADKHELGKVDHAIATNWNQMRSRVMLVLMQQTPRDLLSDEGMRHLTTRLIAEMSLTLFPEREAVVDRILWNKVLVQ